MDFMMEKIAKFLIIFLMLFSGSNMYSNEKNKKEEEKAYLKYAREIVQTFTNEIRRDFGLCACEDGGRMRNDVEMISVDFIAYQQATIDQARELLIKVHERFLKIINSHEKIRPFLREYPFTQDRARVAIAFYNKKNNYYYRDGSVAFVYHIRGNIFYDKEDPKTEMLEDLHKEPFKEALKKVNTI